MSTVRWWMSWNRMMPLPRASSRARVRCGDSLGRVLVVVLAVDIDVEHHGAALYQAGAQEPGLRQIGKAEERRQRLARLPASASDSALALGDLVHGRLAGQLGEVDMVEVWLPTVWPCSATCCASLRMGLGGRAQHQEGRLDAEIVERGENGIGLARARAIVEGQDDFAGPKDDVGGGADGQGAAARWPMEKISLGHRLLGDRRRRGQDAAGRQWCPRLQRLGAAGL